MQSSGKQKQNFQKQLSQVGTYFVLRKIIEECSLNDILGKYFESRDMGLFLDLAVYSIIAEKQCSAVLSGLYIQPIHFFTEKMKQYSDFNRVRFSEFSNR